MSAVSCKIKEPPQDACLLSGPPRAHPTHRPFIPCLGIATWLLAFTLSATSAQAEPSTPGTHPDRWALTFGDDFEGTSLNTTKWDESEMKRQGGNAYWNANLVKVENGLLKLGIQKVVDAQTGAILHYLCGAVSTREEFSSQYHFKQKFGYYEARCKLPAHVNKDYWASFWIMAGPVARNPDTGYVETDTRKAQEIDIFESFTFPRTTHTANFHWAGYDIDHNKVSIPLDSPTANWAKNTALTPAGQFHTYGFYWDPDEYVFYLDGVEIGRTNMMGMGKNANKQDPNKPPLIDYPAQGTVRAEGNILLTCEASTWPGSNSQGWDADAPDMDEFVIDYVRAYDLKPAFTSDPIICDYAAENTAYQSTLAGTATDVSGGTLTFAKAGGPAWLVVAPDGTLSGTPSGNNLGANRFDVSVSDGISTVQTSLNITVKSAFEVWSSGQAPTFEGDANGDDVPDGVAWILGSPSPGQSATALLPATQRSGEGGCTVIFHCLNAAQRGSASLHLQFSRDLGLTDPWTNHTVTVPHSSGTDPASGVVFVITPNGNQNQVQATIPASAADADGRIFCRLQALPTP